MSAAVARRLGRFSAREVSVDGLKFDVVAYDRTHKLFKLAECKLTSRPVSIGRTFGQLMVYQSAVAAKGSDFVNAVSERVSLGYKELMAATRNGKKIRVEFYVALPHKACLKLNLIDALKKLMPHVGIIRVKPDGTCMNYVRRDGKKDRAVCSARPLSIQVREADSE